MKTAQRRLAALDHRRTPMTRKRRRLWIVLACGLGLGSAAALALSAFRDNLVFFLAPSDIATKAPALGRDFRLGGLVEQGSVQRITDDGHPTARFRVTDGKASVEVSYVGILPDLFREGQGDRRARQAGAERDVPRVGGAGEARRDVYAEGSGRCVEEVRPLESGCWSRACRGDLGHHVIEEGRRMTGAADRGGS